MDRDKYFSLVNDKISNKNTIKHSLAVEAVMRALASHSGEDAEIWGLAGLLHDLDYEETAAASERHGLVTVEWLKDSDIPAEVFDIIKAHNADGLGIKLDTKAGKAIFAADPVTGLITASALMQPSKKLADLSTQSLIKKFKNKKFAAGASREHMLTCEGIGIPIEEFLDLSLKAMQGISDNLGL
jgi:putative nucleotidyltransferase with HDIG domain